MSKSKRSWSHSSTGSQPAHRRYASRTVIHANGGGPDEAGAPVLEATREECDGREYRLTYDLRPYESLIVELP